MSFGLKVPPNWQDPSGDPGADHYRNYAFKADEKTTTPDMGSPPGPLFQPKTLNKYHTDLQKQHNSQIGAFIDKTCEAICSAWDTWQKAATMAGIVITGPCGVGGQIVGPPWAPLIMAQGMVNTPQYMKYTTAIANTLGTAWLTYTATIKLAGMPLWPLFAAFPLAVAPPQPNPVPCMLMAQISVDAGLQVPLLKQQMQGMLGDPMAPFNGELFESICDAFNKCFTIWKAATMFNLLGGGPVPTWAPPYVPVGPVAGGVGTMAPGGMV